MFGLDDSDTIVLAGVVVTLIIGTVTITFTALARHDAKNARRDAKISADEASAQGERMTKALERLADTATQRLQQAPTAAAGIPAVTWEIEHQTKNQYVIRNLGGETATGVSVEHPGGQELVGRFPADETVAPLTSKPLLFIPAWGAPIPAEIVITWTGPGQGGRQVVPLPP